MSKRLLGEPIPLGYLVITNPDGGHTGQTASRISLKDARKLLKTEDIIVYIFKVPKIMYGNFMFKYPLCEYYKCLEINNYESDVWTSLNVINKQEKDFTEYIELVREYNETIGYHEYKILYKTI